ncbi:amino acid adenylation domain-containing protein [Lysobacter terrae]
MSSLFSDAEAKLEVPLRANNVLALFCEAVDANPSAAAISWRDVDTTYGELDRTSNQVAHALTAHGIACGSMVALLLDAPVARIAAILGCLKAGCIFVPLDASYPVQRLMRMLDIARPAAVIADAPNIALLATLAGGATDQTPSTSIRDVFLMGDGDDLNALHARVHRIAEQSTDRIQAATLPDDPCYLYFTSGSTGKPKAILGRIRGLAHFVQWEIEAFALGAGSRVSQLTGAAFDVYLRDVLTPLCCGGTICIPPTPMLLDPLQLSHWIERSGVTLIHCVPSLFRLLLRQGLAAAGFPALKFVLLAGEVLPPADANAWIACFGERIRLVNLYGPTETTLAKFCYRLPAYPVAETFVPIGTPIPGAQALLLDEHLAPCTPGTLGEIFIRTPYRSLGYYTDPEATEAAFIRNPFSADPNDRLYRTGDLAQQLPDGNFRFAGRKDFQVKIRGNRVELGEIEARLREHPDIGEAAVIAREDRQGEMRLVAYYVLRGGQRATGAEAAAISSSHLHRHLADALPAFMVPESYVALDRFPLTPNGKLDRATLPAPGADRPEQDVAYAPPITAEEKTLCAAFATTLGIDRVGRHDNFFEIGGNSLLAMRLLAQVQEGAGEPIPGALIFDHPTPATLAAALAQRTHAIEAKRLPQAHRAAGTAREPTARDSIAIIAMAGRFPGAGDVERFWDNLCAARDSITVFRREQLDPSIAMADRLDPAYVTARGVIEGVEDFDCGFFGVSPREAELMDPQHRIFLELCWECMERAGHVPDATTAPVGVFAGTYHSTYLQRHVAAHPDLMEAVGAYQVILDNEKDYIATRIAHKLNLTGPAISIYTACSTSLVAICQAMQSLQAGACDMALAGGVSIVCPPRRGHHYQEGAMFSPDGHTRSFDAQAKGTVFSDGAAVVLLKRLPDAIADGDPVHAVILGGAVNNDGGGKASFTAPSSEGQAAVIAMAQDNAHVSPRDIAYVEAHGTATPMGDPIEIEGLTKAFRRGTTEVGFCRIGSVKSNIGHLVIAAGATGVIKTALALEYRCIPASLHFERANPAIAFADSPFVVNSEASAWMDESTPRRAGVSSFGVGGTNAHVVLEQAPPLRASDSASGPNLLVLSARSPAALAQAAERLADFLQADNGTNLADAAWTLAVGRKAFAHRASVVATQVEDAVRELRNPEFMAAIKRNRAARHREVVFAFPGQGAQYAGMGRALYASEPEFAVAFDQCADALRDAGADLHDVAFSDDPTRLLPTAVMQPAIFSIEYALARWWMSKGLQPTAMIGHSIGEFVAATLAGVFTLPDAVCLVAKRGALMQAQPAGSMLSVRLGIDEVVARLPPGLSLAAENAPGACVVAGPSDAIAAFQAQLDADGIACRALRTSHAFHSAMMEPVVAPFRAAVEAVPRGAPQLPIMSTVSGNWLDIESAISSDYWSRHLRQPVRFAAALARLVADAPPRVLLEVGPRATLSLLARQHPEAQRASLATVPSLGDAAEHEGTSVLAAAGQLWCHGVAMKVAQFDRRVRRRRVRLPTYPFERQRCWVEAGTGDAAAPSVAPMPATEAAETEPVMAAAASQSGEADRYARLLAQLREVFGGTSGFDLAGDDAATNFIELGLDSLMLTQVAVRLQKIFSVPVTFRQLMTDCASLESLARMLDERLPREPPAAPVALRQHALMDAAQPLVPGARIGREPDGSPAWFVPNPKRPGRYLKVGT